MNKVNESLKKVERHSGESLETAQASRNKKTEQMNGVVEKRSAKDNSPEKKNYQKPRAENQHGQPAEDLKEHQ